MNIYQWLLIIFLADVALVMFVRGADERHKDSRKRETEWRRA